MKLLVVLALVTMACAFEHAEEWEAWKKKFTKVYETTEEEIRRHVIFEMNMKYVDLHNSHVDVYGFTTELNEFADLDIDEFSQIYNGYIPPKDEERDNLIPALNVDVNALPASIDWRTKGLVTPVKNQGQCGSCYTFSSTGAIEGAHANKTGQLVSLSEQNLVDCTTSYGNGGCNGGWMANCFRYVMANKGIETESSYPYEMKQGSCRYDASGIGATIRTYGNVRRSEASLQYVVAMYGPTSVAIDVTRSFQLYSSGVYYEPGCSSYSVNHAVLAAGYGTSGGKAFWLVKNSWGARWGDQGYIMMSRNRGNNCGIASYACIPLA